MRLPTAERRPQIAATALQLIGEDGFAALTMARLAAAIGMTSGALFRHFASRDEILAFAVDHAVAQLEATFPADELPPLERLTTLARARIRLVRAQPGLAWLLLSEEPMSVLPDDAKARLERLVKRSRRFLLDTLRSGIEDGSIRNDIAPEALVIPVAGTIQMLIRSPGPHRAAFGARIKSDRALVALETLLQPPTGDSR